LTKGKAKKVQKRAWQNPKVQGEEGKKWEQKGESTKGEKAKKTTEDE